MLYAIKPIEKIITKKIILFILLYLIITSTVLFLILKVIKFENYFILSCILFLMFFYLLKHKISKIINEHVSKPLNELAKLTSDITAGNYNTHITLVSESEFGTFAQNLNFMINTISNHLISLEEQLLNFKNQINQLQTENEILKSENKNFKSLQDAISYLLSFDFKTSIFNIINQIEIIKYIHLNINQNTNLDLNFDLNLIKNNIENYTYEYIKFLNNNTEQISLKLEKINLLELIDNIINGYNLMLRLKKLEIIKEIEPNVKFIMADELKLSVIINNLISNAIKFSLAQNQINIKLFFEGESLFFSITNIGKNISEEIQEKIFLSLEPITTSGTYNESGLGIGLKLCKIFLDIHGGSFWFENKNNYITFNFKIPAAKCK